MQAKRITIVKLAVALAATLSMLGVSCDDDDDPMGPVAQGPSIWREVSGTPSGYYSDIWGTSSNDIFLVGQSGTIVHYDGSNWTPMNSGTTVSLRGVWGNAGDDVYAVGDSGTILHYDGDMWSSATSRFQSAEFTAIWGSSDHTVFVVGRDYDSALVVHFDGTDWQAADLGGHYQMHLHYVSGHDGNHVTAMGKGTTVLRFDGSTWTAGSIYTDSFCEGSFMAGGICCISDSMTFVACFCSYNSASMILRYDGEVWRSVTAPIALGGPDLQDIWAGSGEGVFAVGNDGTILYYDGVCCHLMDAGTDADFTAVWGTGPDNVYVLGHNLYRYGK